MNIGLLRIAALNALTNPVPKGHFVAKATSDIGQGKK